MTDAWTLRRWRACTLAELEAEWASPRALPVPRGLHRGHVLQRMENATARDPLWRWGEELAFARTPFWVDFDRRCWCFGTPRVGFGRFEVQPGRSRWRDTDAMALRYERSRIPNAVRRWLYDEVKPVADGWVLGIGGIDAGRDAGDHFFFVLEQKGETRDG